jgi:hypothetical protein
VTSAAERVQAFIDMKTASKGYDPEHIYGINDVDLTVSDLREVLKELDVQRQVADAFKGWRGDEVVAARENWSAQVKVLTLQRDEARRVLSALYKTAEHAVFENGGSFGQCAGRDGGDCATCDALSEAQAFVLPQPDVQEARRLTYDEAAAAPTDRAPHEFVGRTDRWCEVCDRPDRHPVHLSPLATLERPRRLRTCVAQWPDCEDGDYNPHCCRFPKECSCRTYHEEYIAEADLEPRP